MEDDFKTYTNCFLALRKKAIDIEENPKGGHLLRRVSANLRPETPKEDA